MEERGPTWRAGALLAAIVVNSVPALAAASAGTGTGDTFTFVYDNDLFYDVDRHYTSGVRIVWVPGPEAPRPQWAPRLARWLPWFPATGDVRHGYAFGQSMYTPANIEATNPPQDDRPYAGWLYASLGIGVGDDRQLDLFSLTAGTVGPAARAKEVQRWMHGLVDATLPAGWDTQLRNETALLLAYQRRWREAAGTSWLGAQVDLTPHLGIAAGNLMSHAAAGFTVRYGLHLPRDYGPPRIEPGGPAWGDFSPVQQISGYLFAAVEVRAVANNLFLDGNTWQDSRSVTREDVVSDLQFGLVVDWHTVRVSYTHVLRTREFTTQQEDDDFGALSVSVKY